MVLCCWWVQQLTVLPSRAACVGLIAAGALALLARGALLGCFGRRMAIRVWSLRAARRLSCSA